ncbi:hypothetical protein [Caminibacter sp.]
MRIFIIFILLLTANANTTNEEILKKLNKIEHNQELIKQEMKLRFEGIDRRFEAIDKRFESIDKRFEDMNKRFETLTNFILALTTGIFGLIGFMMWDRRTVAEKARREMEKSDLFNKKADIEYVNNLVKAINELLAKDETARDIFKKYGII